MTNDLYTSYLAVKTANETILHYPGIHIIKEVHYILYEPSRSRRPHEVVGIQRMDSLSAMNIHVEVSC